MWEAEECCQPEQPEAAPYSRRVSAVRSLVLVRTCRVSLTVTVANQTGAGKPPSKDISLHPNIIATLDFPITFGPSVDSSKIVQVLSKLCGYLDGVLESSGVTPLNKVGQNLSRFLFYSNGSLPGV